MFALFFGATLFAGFAGMLLFGVLLKRVKVERYFTALAFALLLFEIFNAIAFAAVLFLRTPWQGFLAQSLGYVFLLMLPISTWAATPLMQEKRNRTLLKLAALGLSIAFGFAHAQRGLLQAWEMPEAGAMLVLTSAGKFFFAVAIVGAVLLLSKFEAFVQALEWRAGKRSGSISGTLFLFMLALIVSCSMSLIYGRLDHVLWLVCQMFFGVLCLLLFFAFKNAPLQPQIANRATLRVTRMLSSSVLIYAGAYCLAFGLLVKAALLLGGAWHLFVSFFTALGAVVLALMLLTENSLHQRWTRFVDRHWRAESYDFRNELHTLTEKLATATDESEMAQAICAGLQEIFASTHCCLWISEERTQTFSGFMLDTRGQFEAQAEALVLTPKQVAWLERVEECFAPEQLLNLNENLRSPASLWGAEEENTNLGPPRPASTIRNGDGARQGAGATLQSCACLTTMHVGRNLVGMIGLGPKRNSQTFREEDQRLLEVLANAASLALHEAYLQQRVLAARQSESIYRIASFIAHDLRHAVSALTLLAHNAKAHLDKPAFRADFLTSLGRVSHEMHTLIQRLAEVKTGGESTHFTACNVAQLISEVVADVQIAPPLVLDLKLEALPEVWWDAEQVRVVLRNLLVNAVEAMPSGGTLSVHAYGGDEQVRISVCDEGAGMSPEFIRHRLFRPNQTTKAKGLGIGLYQSREIVRAHRGEIHVASEIGKGTRFEVVLPRKAEKYVIQKKAL